MKRAAALAGLAALAIAGGVALFGTWNEPPVSFTAAEREAILAHGPWPPPLFSDPSNRVSGMPAAIAFGLQLFSDPRLSADGLRSCATCHDPANAFADRRPNSVGIARVDRNSIALANLRLNRWFGWTGAADSLWAQSIHPILDGKELGLSAQVLQERIGAKGALAATYSEVFGSRPDDDAADRVLANIAKALAAFQETILTPRTAFDHFRDALVRGDAPAAARYPAAAHRGLKLFVGEGRCSLCHLGPNFTSGEFEDIGLRHFAEPGRVDSGRHGGIARLQASPFTLRGPYNDDPANAAGLPTRHLEPSHRNWGEFRVPSLRNVANTAPYMHNGSLPTLEAVLRHYSEVDIERLHGEEGKQLIRPLHLSPRQLSDLASFLRTLSNPPASAP